jgi:hypothetical protein
MDGIGESSWWVDRARGRRTGCKMYCVQFGS